MFGLLNINKPSGWTSRGIVTRVSRLVGRRVKCGHAGTLDPLASGVLLVCIGKATKLVPLIHEHSKSYTGTFQLGVSSPTDDTEGELTEVDIPEDLNAETIEQLLPEFTGEITQVPPTHSAIWINGERAYEAARRGDEIEMPERQVVIDWLKLDDFDGQRMTLSMQCGTGTYVRSIGRDIARRANTEAVMESLVRTSIGPFTLENAVSIDELTKENVQQHLHSPLNVLDHLPRYIIDTEEETRLRHGRRIRFDKNQIPDHCVPETIVVTDPQERLIALVAERSGELAPQMVFPESQ